MKNCKTCWSNISLKWELIFSKLVIGSSEQDIIMKQKLPKLSMKNFKTCCNFSNDLIKCEFIFSELVIGSDEQDNYEAKNYPSWSTA